MSTSGVKIGMEITAVVHRPTLRVQVVALSAWCVPVAGVATRVAVVSLIVAAAFQNAVSTAADSASPVPLSNRLKAT